MMQQDEESKVQPIDPVILRMAITAAYWRCLVPGVGHVVAAAIDACILLKAAAKREERAE